MKRLKLEQDKKRLEQLITQTQIQLYRYDGALAYIQDNLKKINEAEDDRKGANRTK